MIIPILPLYIEKLLGSVAGAKLLTGQFVAITGVISGISAIIYGKIGAKFGYTRVLVYSLIATGIVTIPQAFAHTISILFIERCLFGLAVGGLIPSVNALVSNIVSKEKIGSAYGLTSAVTCFGIGMGPFLGAIIASFVGLQWPFAVMGASAFIVAFLVYKMLFHRERDFS